MYQHPFAPYKIHTSQNNGIIIAIFFPAIGSGIVGFKVSFPL